MRKRWFIVLAVLMVFSLAACGGATEQPDGEQANEGNANGAQETGEVITLKLGHQTPESTNYHQLSLKFKELVEEKSNGQVKIEIYPNRQLGTDRELLEAMQFGNLDLGVISSPPISGFAPEFMVLDLPFIFENWDHVESFIGSDIYRELLATSEKAGLKTFELMARGFRHVTTTDKPIQKPEDLQELDLRVIETPIYVQAYEALGANAKAMSWPDAYTALEQGAIDGQENTMDIIHDERVYEVNNTVSKTGITFTFAALMGSKQTFDQLPEDVQQIITEAAQEAVAYINPINREKESEFEGILEEKGMTIYDVDQKPFKQHVQQIYDKFTSEHGDQIFNGINALR